MAHLKIVMADNNIYMQKIMMANDLLLEAEKILNNCYTQKNHPDYAKIYYKFGVMRQNIKKAFIVQATVLLSLEKLTSNQKLLGLKLILAENDIIRKIFDSFRNHGFVIFLEQKLKAFLETQSREQPKRIRTDHKELEAMIEMQNSVEEIAEKSIIIMQREKVQLDFHGAQWFDKSMQLCKILFSEDNPFFQQVKEQFEATRKIGRAKKRF